MEMESIDVLHCCSPWRSIVGHWGLGSEIVYEWVKNRGVNNAY